MVLELPQKQIDAYAALLRKGTYRDLVIKIYSDGYTDGFNNGYLDRELDKDYEEIGC